ncbi:unnamed protein product [Arctia plantaginis]|uniref:Uncharacterized protein n=1 Tax=Arctia plantaginis TaxID=874455 RepID=A0A8S1AF43_ARCPL|nr:unnamed protein product [Arctia plantaginis]
MDPLAHIPSGSKMRAEIFHNKSSVHLPFSEYLHRGHAYLTISRDHMQTAVDAFAIFLAGSLEDVMRLPPEYVLQSARTIAMMRIAREKLASTWLVVKGSTPTHEVTYETLEKFRPLFKYINGKEMARLNLLDKRILSFIGTHPDLSRHQVGVIASQYTQLNPNWTEARYLNVMNNLLCGVPMLFMRGIPKHTYLQLTHQALGKSYSWSARDVSRLGLLLAEVDAQSFSAINPEAMAGITSQVVSQIPTEVLLSVTEMQMRFMEPKSLNILAKKINAYRIQRGGLMKTSSSNLLKLTDIVIESAVFEGKNKGLQLRVQD